MHITKAQFNHDLLEFLKHSPTSYHAVRSMANRLEAAGFSQLDEKKSWQLKPKTGYYVVRNGSSIIAFTTGKKGDFITNGTRMVGAHSDSPCLKLKPNPELSQHGYYQLGVEVYGGALLSPWFDRDLSIAGRVSWIDSNAELNSTLIDFEEPIATIPSLAIHLDRNANKGRNINPELHISPVLATQVKNEPSVNFFHQLLTQQILRRTSSQLKEENICILDSELFFYDTQSPSFIGLEKEFLASARLDNLLSCFTNLQALIASRSDHPCLLVSNDHEEVGSKSAVGAAGPFLKTVLERVVGIGEPMAQAMQQSIMISADNAHAIHPNFSEKHDKNHKPVINGGPVIKVNANQRYATTSETSALFRKLCQEQGVPVQTFTSRTDVGCGSTIGPITATQLGVPTLDIGLPTFAMHSIRELAGRDDAYQLSNVLVHFFNTEFKWNRTETNC